MTEPEIKQYIETLKPYYFMHKNYMMTFGRGFPITNILVTSTDLRVLGISEMYSSVDPLKNYNTEIRHTFGHTDQQDITIPADEVWRLKFNRTNSVWILNSDIDADTLYFHILSQQKINVLDTINSHILVRTAPYNNRMPYEHYISFLKYKQATDILENNVLEDELLKYPLVAKYAEGYNIDLQHAAKQIKFNIDEDISFLSEIESIKIKYYSMIKNESKLENLSGIFSEFVNQFHNYAHFNS